MTKDKSPEMGDNKIKISSGTKNSKTKKAGSGKSNRVWKFLTKKISKRTTLVVVGVAFLLALITIAANLYFSVFGSSLDSYYSYPEYEGPVLDTPSSLTGVMTTKKKASQKVVCAMIENHPAARPQSGLSQAGLVYEALVEGGITRFLAFFSETDSEKIGPVRSARSYYLPWVVGLDAYYAHVGGSALALEQISNYGVKDLNQFYNSEYFWRDSSRYSPHNVYTTTADLRQAGEKHGWPGENSFESWEYSDEVEGRDNPVKDIVVNYSGSQYQVSYRYLAKHNKYRRSMAGELHKDLEGAQIKPTNLVVMEVDQGLSGDGVHLFMNNLGSGEAYIFRGGEVIKGEWSKPSIDDRIVFYGTNGEEVIFNRGSAWIHVVSSIDNLSYSR